MKGGKAVQSIFQGNLFAVVAIVAVGLCAGQSAADWDVYVSGGLGISTAIVDTDGINQPGPVLLNGEDDDASPLIDGAFGLRIPMNEIVPREWLNDVRLPDWPVRFEFEAAGLREFELVTDQSGGTTSFFTEWTATTLFFNSWLDIPLTEIWRPVQFLGGLGRQPRVRQWLDPGSFYVGSGVGFSYLEIDGTSNTLTASDEIYGFAWNVGTGFNYALTEKVELSAGYRFVGLGEQDLDLFNGPAATGEITYTPEVHEFRVQVRVEVYEFLSPWR